MSQVTQQAPPSSHPRQPHLHGMPRHFLQSSKTNLKMICIPRAIPVAEVKNGGNPKSEVSCMHLTSSFVFRCDHTKQNSLFCFHFSSFCWAVMPCNPDPHDCPFHLLSLSPQSFDCSFHFLPARKLLTENNWFFAASWAGNNYWWGWIYCSHKNREKCLLPVLTK